MRSLLLVPADDPRRLAEALKSEADAVVVDFENCASRKLASRARAVAREFLVEAKAPATRPALLARLRPLDDRELEADLDSLVAALPDAVALRATGGGDVRRLALKLAVREAEAGARDGGVGVIAVAASGAAMLALDTYRGASRRLRYLSWDATKLARDLGARGAVARPLRVARGLIVFAAASAGVGAIDGACAASCDLASLRAECARARRDGFVGKFALQQDQVRSINEAFSSAPAKREDAASSD